MDQVDRQRLKKISGVLKENLVVLSQVEEYLGIFFDDKFSFEDGGWMLIRFSGTEPLIRVYCETTHVHKVQAILDSGLKIVGLTR